MTDREKLEAIRAEIERRLRFHLERNKEYDNSITDVLYGCLHFINSFPEEPVSEDLPHIRHRDILDEFAYQCAYDLSNDWAKETPEWKDVKTACKLGAQWQREQMIKSGKWWYCG